MLASDTPETLPLSAGPVGRKADERLRRCIVGGKPLPRAGMVRYVVMPGPDGDTVVPDVAGRLPGRGLWTEARRDIVAAAVARRSFVKAAGTAVKVPADLDDRVAALLTRRVLDLVGMARRAGQAVPGFDPACQRLERGEAGLLLLAADAAPPAVARLTALARQARVDVVRVLGADELGQVFARPRVAQLVLARGRLARAVAAESTRLAGFRPTVDGQSTN